MPRKPKPHNPVASPDDVWIAPRPANPLAPRTYEPAEPAGAVRYNRYLEFADIALGAKQASRQKKKSRGKADDVQHTDPESNVTPINRPRVPRFGAFRGPR
jgi:hypothetical protein